jgi:hypothetical protein
MSNRWKNFFSSTSMSAIGLSNCWSFCHLCQHTPYLITVLNNLWLQSVSMFVTKVTSCSWWIVHICQYIHVTFISPDHCCQAISCFGPNITMFQSFVVVAH